MTSKHEKHAGWYIDRLHHLPKRTVQDMLSSGGPNVVSEKQRSQLSDALRAPPRLQHCCRRGKRRGCKETKLYSARCPEDGRLPREMVMLHVLQVEPRDRAKLKRSVASSSSELVMAVLPMLLNVAAYSLLLCHAAK